MPREFNIPSELLTERADVFHSDPLQPLPQYVADLPNGTRMNFFETEDGNAINYAVGGRAEQVDDGLREALGHDYSRLRISDD